MARGRFHTTVRRDTITWVFGLAGLGYMLITENVNLILAIIFASMAQVPGLAGLIALLRGLPTSGSALESPSSLDSPSSSPTSHTS